MPGPAKPLTVPSLTILAADHPNHTSEQYLTKLLRKPAIAIVGSRAATTYGEHVAYDLGQELANAGATLLTDGQYGIGAAATRGALSAGGKVVVFQPCGITPGGPLHPSGNAVLFEDVLVCDGTIVSIFKPDTPVSRFNSDVRMDLMSDVAGAIIVVEAAVRSTVLRIGDANPQVPMFAVPGPITSAASGGAHQLLRSGRAKVLTELGDLGDLGELLGNPVLQGDPGKPFRWATHEYSTDFQFVDGAKVYDGPWTPCDCATQWHHMYDVVPTDRPIPAV